MIENARGRLATQFMEETDAEWAIFIDDDVIPPFGNPDLVFRFTGCPETPQMLQVAQMKYWERLMSYGARGARDARAKCSNWLRATTPCDGSQYADDGAAVFVVA